MKSVSIGMFGYGWTCLLFIRVQALRQRARELAMSIQTELLDRLEARRLQRPQSTSSETANDAVDGSSTQADILQRIQQCLLAVQRLQVTILGCRFFRLSDLPPHISCILLQVVRSLYISHHADKLHVPVINKIAISHCSLWPAC